MRGCYTTKKHIHLTSFTTHPICILYIPLCLSIHPAAIFLYSFWMDSMAYNTWFVISHLRKLGTQPSALLHSSLGRLPVPSASLGLPGLWRVWIKDAQRLILSHFDPHLKCLATKEFCGSLLHRNPKRPEWQHGQYGKIDIFWNHVCRHTRICLYIFVCKGLIWILYKNIYVLTTSCCFCSDLPHHIKRISWELPGCWPHQELKWFSKLLEWLESARKAGSFPEVADCLAPKLKFKDFSKAFELLCFPRFHQNMVNLSSLWAQMQIELHASPCTQVNQFDQRLFNGLKFSKCGRLTKRIWERPGTRVMKILSNLNFVVLGAPALVENAWIEINA